MKNYEEVKTKTKLSLVVLPLIYIPWRSWLQAERWTDRVKVKRQSFFMSVLSGQAQKCCSEDSKDFADEVFAFVVEIDKEFPQKTCLD